MSSLSDDVTQLCVNIHINELESFRLDGVRSDETFSQIMDQFIQERCMPKICRLHKFALLPSDIEKSVLSKLKDPKKNRKELLKELIHVQMNDSIGQSTYAMFISKENTIHLQLSPTISPNESKYTVLWTTTNNIKYLPLDIFGKCNDEIYDRHQLKK